jgi:plastocyanin
MRRIGLTFAVVAALGASALGAGTSVPSAVAAGNSPAARTSGDGNSLTAGQKAARNKALRKCNSKRTRNARKTCRARVRKRFAPKPELPVQPAPAAVIDVGDDYFSPDTVNIDRGDNILWVWNELNHDPHDLTLITHPPGVRRSDFETGYSPSVKYRFRRTFNASGTYNFICSLHFQMKIDVVVK